MNQFTITTIKTSVTEGESQWLVCSIDYILYVYWGGISMYNIHTMHHTDSHKYLPVNDTVLVQIYINNTIIRTEMQECCNLM